MTSQSDNRTVESLGCFSSHEVSYQWEKCKKAFKKELNTCPGNSVKGVYFS